MDILLSTLVSGLILSSLYALMASGLSVIWTTLGVFNFAHGLLMTVCAYITWHFAVYLEWGLFIGACIGVLAIAGIGVLMERWLVRPFYKYSNMLLVTVMTSLACMTILEKTIHLIWGARLKRLPKVAEGEVSVFGVIISAHEAVIVVLAPVILIVLWIFMAHTRTGRSLRAVGQNQVAAKLIGINVEQVFSLAFGVSAVLAGVAGILLGGLSFVKPLMGDGPLIKAMIVIILGGLGSIGATVGGAYVIGFLEAILIVTIGLYWTPFVLFLFMILVLLYYPNGIFGGRNRDA